MVSIGFYMLSFLVYLLNLSPVAQRWSTAHHMTTELKVFWGYWGPLVIWR